MQNSGMIIEYKKSDGTIQKGLIQLRDQTESLRKQAKAIVTLLLDDLSEMLDSQKKPMKVIKSIVGVKPIGFNN